MHPGFIISITEPAVYYDTDDNVWLRGEIPVIRVELSLNDTSRYRFASSTKISVSGFRSEVKSRRVLDGGDGLRVEIKRSLDEPNGSQWERG